MSGLRLSLRAYRLALRRPLRVGGQDVPVREGSILRIEDEAGFVGYGDVAPLPGLSRETLGEARTWLQGVDVGTGGLGAVRERILAREPAAPPSAWFALEAALVWLEARRKAITPAEVLSESPLASVAVNALFDGGLDSARAALEGGLLAPYATVKVKCARRDAATERAVIETLLAGLPESTRLRLDANRGLSLDAACHRFGGLAPERIEYVEEPLADPGGISDFHARTGLRVALDESLQDARAVELVEEPAVTALVLKPAVRGGVLETLADAERARARGKQVVISSCFESGLGLGFLAQLAAAAMDAGVAAGLATDRWFAEDVLAPPFDSRGGRIDPSDWPPGFKGGASA